MRPPVLLQQAHSPIQQNLVHNKTIYLLYEKTPDIAVNRKRIAIFLLAIELLYPGFSGQALAYHRLENPQQYSVYNIDTASLARLHQHTTDFLWLENKQMNPQAHQALNFIADSSWHGLKPDDYRYSFLQQLDPARSQASALHFDLLLSDSLLKLIADISMGRLNPVAVDPKWAIPQTTFDAVAFLQQALASPRLIDSLNALYPETVHYRQIKAAAARYKNYVNRGGWAEINNIPPLAIGDIDEKVAAVRERLALEGYISGSDTATTANVFDEALKQAVQQFQYHHSLKADGTVNPATLQAMNVSAAQRLLQININLERLRWLPDDLGKRYLMVNLANYRLTAMEDGEVKLDMPVIVGKTSRATPSFSSEMTQLVLNPHWYVPHKLAVQDLLPKQQKDPDYFSRNQFRVFHNENGHKIEINPDSIDWHTVKPHYFPYSLVQAPGERNALGRLKFILPNPWRIYLHDTPSKSLFKQTQRNFSAGCIRVKDPVALAAFSLAGDDHQLLDRITSNTSQKIELKQPLPVYVIYATVWLNNNELIFSPDSYRRDQKMAGYL